MDLTPAEERAEREGLNVVRLTAFELLRVASGNPMIVSTADGGEVLLRPWQPDELLEASVAAGRKLAEQGLPPGPGMTHDDAVRLCRPLPI